MVTGWESGIWKHLFKRISQLNYIGQLRARFIIYLCIPLLVAISLIMLIRYFLHLNGNISYWPVPILIPMFFFLVITALTFLLIMKGHLRFAGYLLSFGAMAMIWSVMFLDQTSGLLRLDTIVYIFAVFSFTPLLFGRNIYLLLLIPIVNIIILFLFMGMNGTSLNLSSAEIWDYTLDVSLALFLTGFVSFHIYAFNKKAAKKATIDCDRRLEAEKALIKSEKKYKDMADLLPVMISEADLRGNIKYINQTGLSIFGFTEEDVKKGINYFTAILETDRVLSNTEKIIHGQRVGNYYTAIRKNGERFPVQIFSSAIFENDKPVGLRGVLLDISNKVKAEQTIARSERKYREMTQLLPQTIYEADFQGKITYINKAGTEMFGFQYREVILGKFTVFDAVDEKDHYKVREDIKAILGGYITVENQYTGKKLDGRNFPFQMYSSVITEDNKPIGFRGVVLDITRFVESQEEIKRNYALFRTLIESTPVSTTVSHLDGRFITANKAFYNELGLSSEEVINKTSKQLGIETNPEDKRKLDELLKKDGQVQNYEARITYRNKEFIVCVSAIIIKINNQQVVLRSNVNITEKKKLEDQLRENESKLREYNLSLEKIVNERTSELDTAMEQLKSTNEELQATNDELYIQREHLELTLKQLQETQEQLIHTEKMASIGILTAGIAHEINNPVNYIYNGAMAIQNYISEHLSDHFDELKPFFEAINTGIGRTTSIIRSLGSYSRMDAMVQSKCPVHDILDNALTMLFHLYKSRIEIIKEYDAEDKMVVSGIESNLHQAFMNILLNAIQAIEQEGTIRIKTLTKQGKVEVSICDSGSGISHEHLKHIFDPFFTTKDPGKGTGLGLSITQNIIHEHKGTIECRSKIGAGSEFIINLPVNHDL